MIEKLHYISQGTTIDTHLLGIEKVLLEGCTWIQLRVKNQTEAEILPLAIEAVKLCEKHGAKLIVNDHPLIAVKSGAHGIHLGLNDMSIPEARKIAGPEMIIGGTANTMAHMQLRANEGADYIGLGPFRFTGTKKNLSPIIGLEGYIKLMQKAKVAGIKVPVIAIGGIELTDTIKLMSTGIHGIALSGALTNHPEQTATILSLFESNAIS